MFNCRHSYLLVDRDFIIEKLLNDNACIYKFTAEDRKIARIKTDEIGFFSYNSHIEMWKVDFENCILISLKPIEFPSDL